MLAASSRSKRRRPRNPPPHRQRSPPRIVDFLFLYWRATSNGGGVGLLHDCDIGFGVRGVYFASADSAAIVGSRIHHYVEEGVFDFASDVLVQDCTVERGALLHPDTLTTGIRAKSSVPQILTNTIGWQDEYGIWLRFPKLWCQAALPWTPEDTLRVVDNTITGKNGEADLGSTAILGEYLCQHHTTEIEHNMVTAWDGRAVDLYQSADVHLRCNRLEDNFTAAQYYRDDKVLQSFEGDVYWKQNALKRSYLANLLVAHEEGLQVLDWAGGGQKAGHNSFQRKAEAGDVWNIQLQSGSIEPYVNAREQAWLYSTGTVIMDTTVVQATNDPGHAGVIDVDTPLSAEDLPCSQGAQAQTGGRTVLAGPEHSNSTATGGGGGIPVPDRWSIDLRGSHPSGGPLAIVLAVPSAGLVRAVVYDVAGRRVRVLQDGVLQPGYHERTWDRSGRGEEQVAPGVYFLRMEGAGVRMTRKLVLLPAGK